jgi:hypothetical protein
VFEVELYHERDKPSRRYFRRVGDTTIWPAFADDGQPTDDVNPLGAFNRRRGPKSNLHDPAQPDDTRPA